MREPSTPGMYSISSIRLPSGSRQQTTDSMPERGIGIARRADELDAARAQLRVGRAHVARADRDDARHALLDRNVRARTFPARLEPLDQIEAHVVRLGAEREQRAASLRAPHAEVLGDEVGPHDVAVVAQQLEAERLVERERALEVRGVHREVEDRLEAPVVRHAQLANSGSRASPVVRRLAITRACGSVPNCIRHISRSVPIPA